MSEVSAKQESAKSLGLDGTRVGGSLASGQQEHAASQPVESSSTEDESVMFKSDSFRMNCMKVLPCSKRYVHDWTECPFAHPQEKARRRDPRDHQYTGIACPSMKKEGLCAFGDHCPYAHNVFEYWLHPTRYRTQLCNDGTNCRRKICFFAHSLEELRVPACKPFVSPEALAEAAAAAAADVETRRKAGTVGTPMTSGGGGGGGGLPQVDPLTVQQYEAAAAQILKGSKGIKGSPTKASDAGAARPGGEGGRGSPTDPLQGMLQQLQGGGIFSQQEHQVVEMVTTMLSQNKITAAQAASILQAMLSSNALALLQSQLLAPETPSAYSADLPLPRRNSDPLWDMGGRASFEDAALSTGRLSFQGGQQAAAMYNTMLALQTGGGQAQQGIPPFVGASPRGSMDYPRNTSLDTVSSMRSSFDATGMRDSLDYGPTYPNSLDYGRGGSIDLRRGSLEMAGAAGGLPPPYAALAQASGMYQPYHTLAPLPEGAAYQHISPMLLPQSQQYSPTGGVPLPPPQYAPMSPMAPLWGAGGEQYGQQHELGGEGGSQGGSSELMRMSADLRRLSLEEQRASIDRRAAPVVANAFASSFFSGSEAAASAPPSSLTM